MSREGRRNGSTTLVEVQVTINGSRAAIWAAITSIENAPETISGIQKIEILARPAHGRRRTEVRHDEPGAVGPASRRRGAVWSIERREGLQFDKTSAQVLSSGA